MEKLLITKEGFDNARSELSNLKNIERPKIIQAIATARELGDLKENAEYSSAREKQSMIEGQIQALENIVSRAEVIDISSIKSDLVRFGATVKIKDINTEKESCYKIVSEYESDPEIGLISNTSPIAIALIGKSVGDDIEIKTPTRIIDCEILEISFK